MNSCGGFQMRIGGVFLCEPMVVLRCEQLVVFMRILSETGGSVFLFVFIHSELNKEAGGNSVCGLLRSESSL